VNKDSVMANLRKKAGASGVTFNTILSQYFHDEFLKLLSKSAYAENFTLKGGIIMTSLLGLDNKTTNDIEIQSSRIQIMRMCGLNGQMKARLYVTMMSMADIDFI